MPQITVSTVSYVLFNFIDLLTIVLSKILVSHYVLIGEFDPYWMPQITASTVSYLFYLILLIDIY